jgi:hypothetical protein
MCRLLIQVEGETEETFVNNILTPHLYNYGYSKVGARLLGKARMRANRGGICSWLIVRKEILNRLKEDRGAIITTMVDYYGLPRTGEQAWPGRYEASNLAFNDKAHTIEAALLEDICKDMGDNFDRNRFIPYVMMHEFEGMLFSNCELFGNGINRPDLIPQFQAIRNQFLTPEEINDSPETAPSKRIKSLIPGYQKPLLGLSAILEIGLDTIRTECPHFREWLEHLEGFLKKAK